MFMTQNIETTNATPNQRDAAVEPHAGRPRFRAALVVLIGFRRRYHFTPALAAASGSMALRDAAALVLMTATGSLSACVSAGTADFASAPNPASELTARLRTRLFGNYSGPNLGVNVG